MLSLWGVRHHTHLFININKHLLLYISGLEINKINKFMSPCSLQSGSKIMTITIPIINQSYILYYEVNISMKNIQGKEIV